MEVRPIYQPVLNMAIRGVASKLGLSRSLNAGSYKGREDAGEKSVRIGPLASILPY